MKSLSGSEHDSQEENDYEFDKEDGETTRNADDDDDKESVLSEISNEDLYFNNKVSF